GDTIGDLKDLIIALSVEILVMGEIFSKRLDAEQAAANSISSGSAIMKLQEMIELHGGDPRICENLTILPKAKKIIPVFADSSGYIAGMETDLIGISTVMLGAGREKKSDAIDHAVGLWLKKRIGERVEKDETLAEFHINDTTNEQEAINLFLRSIHIGTELPKQLPLIVETIG
ncbi:MAG: pyrimidine-nucleoside phosphorylase, partial [Spirochaetales bacterium]|nr:pyrimidine-nucleoside phosphorylase [Spirochaetales bacterium]